jgi:hypothetical protein
VPSERGLDAERIECCGEPIDGVGEDGVRALVEVAVPFRVDPTGTDDLPGLGPHVRDHGGGTEGAR